MTELAHGHGIPHAYETDETDQRRTGTTASIRMGALADDLKFRERDVSETLPGARALEAHHPEHGHIGEIIWQHDPYSISMGKDKPRKEIYPRGLVRNIVVHPEHKRQGVGTALWNRAKTITPWITHSDNQSEEGKVWAGKTAAHWMPKERLFGRTYGLDHRLFDGERLRPDVRKYILETLNAFWKPRYGLSWNQWARVYFAGSEASEWTSENLEGNNDFDILVGVDYNAYRAHGSRKDAGKTDLQITDELNEGFRKGLNPRTANAMIMVDGKLTGPWDNTWYVNPHSYDIREIRPYAAYNVTDDEWAVRPPHLPEWSTKAFPEGKGLEREIRGILDMAKGILAMPEPYRTQNGRALWEFVHSNRSDAFGAQGEGWYDPRNVIEKALDQAGLMQQLWALMDNARKDPHLLDSPAGWSNDPGR
jgi:GNAT superfamily N-acetyltransferase